MLPHVVRIVHQQKRQGTEIFYRLQQSPMPAAYLQVVFLSEEAAETISV